MSERSMGPTALPVEFRFTLTAEEEARLQDLPSTVKATWKNWIPLVLWIVGLALFAAATVAMWDAPYGIITAVIAYAWLFQIVWALLYHAVLGRFATTKRDAWEVCVRLDESGVTQERGPRMQIVSWRQVAGVRLAGGFLCCDRRGRPPIVIPCRCIGSESDAEAFRAVVATARARWNGPERPVGVTTITGPKATFISTRNEIVRMHKRRWSTPNGRRQSFLTVSAYGLGMAALCYHFISDVSIALPIPLWILATIAMVVATSPTTSTQSSSIAAMKQVPGMLGPFCVALSPEKVEVMHSEGTTLTEWSGVNTVGRDRAGISLNFADGSVIAIPKTAFANPAEANAFFYTARGYLRGIAQDWVEDDFVWPPAPKSG